MGRLRRWVPAGDAPLPPTPTIVVWLLGLALLTAGLEIWSLFGPLREPAFAAAAAGSVALILADRDAWTKVVEHFRARVAGLSTVATGSLVVIGISLLAMAALPCLNGDTGLYHAQAIRWLEEIGIAPGLANTEVRLGYNSAWFLPQTLASWGQWVSWPLHSLNLLLLVYFTAHALATPADAPLHSRLLRLILLALLLFFCVDEVASLSPDPAITTLVFVILSQAWVLPTPDRRHPFTPTHVALVLLMCFAVTVKLSAAPLLLLGVVWLIRQPAPARLRILVLSGLGGAALILPWVARNVVLSGYLVCPFPALDLLSVDWKYPRAVLYDHVDYIRNFARNPTNLAVNVNGKPLRFWLPIWWVQQQPYDVALTLLAPVVAALSALALVVRRQWRHPAALHCAIVVAAAVAGVLFWFVTAPAYRFGYGFILSLFALAALPVLLLAPPQLRRLTISTLVVLLPMILIGKMLLLEFRFFAIPRQLTAAEMPAVEAAITTPAQRQLVLTSYDRQPDGGQKLKINLSMGQKLRLTAFMLASQNVRNYGLFRTGHRLILPEQYYFLPSEKFRIGALQMVRLSPEIRALYHGPWYALFPYTAAGADICARGTTLRDGFRACPRPTKASTPSASIEAAGH